MKNYKHVASVAMAAVMLAGSTLPVFAAEVNTGGGDTGDGKYEGYVEETSVFSVNVPTDASATKGFDFFVDPNGLLEKTGYASLGAGVTAADFEAGATLFFERTPDADSTPAVVKYGKDSEAITFANYSSYDVNVEVSAVVSNATGITLASAAITDADAVTDPTLYMAIVSGTETKVITADGAKFTGTIAGEPENFEPQYDTTNKKYIYALKKDTTEAAPTAPWKTVSFNLTGACAGTWTAEQAAVAPTVTLTWKVTDPKAGPKEVTGMSITNLNGATAYDGTTLAARIKEKGGILFLFDTAANDVSDLAVEKIVIDGKEYAFTSAVNTKYGAVENSDGSTYTIGGEFTANTVSEVEVHYGTGVGGIVVKYTF